MTTKKHYEAPAMQVFELKHQPQLLAGSGEVETSLTGGFDDFTDGNFTW